MKSRVVDNLNTIGVFTLVLSSISFLGSGVFISDILMSFSFQYLWIFIILSLVNFIYKNLVFGGIYLLMGSINLFLIYPTWNNINYIKNPDLKIYFANILSSNEKHFLLIKNIFMQNPDIVVLQEVNEKWSQKLTLLDDHYNYKIILSREDNFGMAIFSKFKFAYREILQGRVGVESILFEIRIKNKDINILATHSMPPIGPNYWNLRNKHYKEIEASLNKINGEKLLVGDLNTVPWSSHLKQLSKETGLGPVNTFRDTWNSIFPIGMRIRPDHAFISQGLEGELRVLDSIGSDHLPLILSLKYRD